MNKFLITSKPVINDEDNPVLYEISIGKYYYLHKGKKLDDSLNKILDDVHRELKIKADAKINPNKYANRKDYCPMYSKLIDYCALHPQMYKVSVKLILNAEPEEILKKEAKKYKEMKNDEYSLNNLELGQLKPEWMIRHAYKEKCEHCISFAFVGKNKPVSERTKFNFCPICSRSIK